MKTPVLLLLAVSLAAWPAHAQSKRRKGSGESGAHLPPKSPMLQLTIPGEPVPATPPGTLITSELSGRDLAFLTNAVEAGRAQVALCQTAKEKGESDQVRAVGDALGGTQSQENLYVTRLAAKKGLQLDSSGPPAGSPKTASELGSLSGAKFDKDVMEKIIAAAQQSVASYETGMQSSDPEIKSLAERLLPVAKDKLQLASNILARSQKPAFRTGLPSVGGVSTAAPAPGTKPGASPVAAAKPGASPLPVKPGTTPLAAAAKPGASPAAASPTPPRRPDGPRPVPVLNPTPPASGGSPAPGVAAVSATPAPKPAASPTPAATPAKK